MSRADTDLEVRKETKPTRPLTFRTPMRFSEIFLDAIPEKARGRITEAAGLIINRFVSDQSEQSEDETDLRRKMIRPVDSLLTDALDYRTYRLVKRDQA